MKTKVRHVIIEVECAGNRRRFACPIAKRNGQLMTRRLKKLIGGRISSQLLGRLNPDTSLTLDDDKSKSVTVVWKPPYMLLQEILQDRLKLQRQLEGIEGVSGAPEGLTPVTVIPEKAESSVISKMVLKELDLRNKVKARIKALSW